MYLLIQCYKFGCKGTTKIAYMQIFGRFLANKNKKIALTSDFSALANPSYVYLNCV